MYPYLAEFTGTMMLVFLGLGANAAAGLKGSFMRRGGPLLRIIGWGLAWALPAMVFYDSSGANFNPALTLGLALTDNLEWSMVPGYILAQLAGAFCGACVMWIFYKDQLDASSKENPGAALNVFCTGPAVPDLALNLFCEAFATMMFVIFYMNIPADATALGINFIYIFIIVLSVGVSLGGPTNFAINPARDLAGRLAYQILPVENKANPNWEYAWVPVAGPVIGALIGAELGAYFLRFPLF